MSQLTVSLDGHDHVYLQDGVGGRPLLLVHGFTGSKEDFADEVAPLAALGYHVVVPELLGHGESAHSEDEADYSLGAYAERLIEFTKHLGWSSFDLLGHSMGGMIAQLMVIANPDLVDRLILMDTHHGVMTNIDPEIAALGAELARTDGLEVIQELLKMAEDPLDNPAYQRLCSEREGYRAWSESKMLNCSPSMYAAMLTEFISLEDRLDLLSGIQVPTLVIVGEQDESFVEPSQRIASAIVGATLEVIANGGHSPQMEATDAWRRSVHGFLGAVG